MLAALSFVVFALPLLITAQTPPANFSLEFKLVQCTNEAGPDKDPNTINNATRSWSHIAMYSPNTPQKWNYALPSPGEPYVRYEGNPRTAFFYADAPNPRGFLHTNIPAEAIGYQTDVEAGKVVFEGVDFPCQVQYGYPAWGGSCFDGDYPYCAGYTMCHERFLCKARDAFNPPLQKNADVNCKDSIHSTPRCHPYWVESG